MPSFEDFAKRFWRIEGDRKLGAQSVHAATQSKRNGKHTQGGDAIRGEHAQGGATQSEPGTVLATLPFEATRKGRGP